MGQARRASTRRTGWSFGVPAIAACTALVLAAGVQGEPVARVDPGSALRLSLTVLPFVTAAAPAGAAPSTPPRDLDGYQAAEAEARQPGTGPSGIIAAALRNAEGLAPRLSTARLPAQAPLELHGVLLTFEHRRRGAGWEAAVDLGLRVTDSATGTALATGVYRGRSAARGPLSASQARRLLARGLSRYAGTPLGKAFAQSVIGATGSGAVRLAPGQAASIVEQLRGLAWEASVVAVEAGKFVINAGSENGLHPGLALFPYAARTTRLTAGSRPVRRLSPISGLLRVVSTGPRSSVLAAAPGAPVSPSAFPPGSVVLAREPGQGVLRRSVTAVTGNARVREWFVQELQELLNGRELRQGLPRDALELRGTCEQDGDRMRIDLELVDISRPGAPDVLARNRGVLPEGNLLFGVHQFWKVFERQINLRWPEEGPGAAAESQTIVRRLARRWQSVGSMLGPSDPTAPGVRLRLLNGMPGTASHPVFRDGDEVELEFSADREGFGVLYNVDGAGELQQLWPAGTTPGRLAKGQTVRLPEPGGRPNRVFGNLGEESLVLLVWPEAGPAQELLKAAPRQIYALAPLLEQLSTSTMGAAAESAEPIPAGVGKTSAAPRELLGGFQPIHALALLEYYTEPRPR